MSKRSLKIILVIAALSFSTWCFSFSFEEEETGGAMSCCHASAQQDEPEGNPNHVEPMKECATAPTDKQMVACVCHKWKKCDGQESKSCSSYCWKKKCKCKPPQCE